jgi:phosphoserine phosphatase
LIDPLIYDEAAALIESHHAAGHDVIIVSSSGEDVVAPIGEMLGADHVVATRLEVDAGSYTGKVEFYAAGDNKAVAIRELAAAHGYELDRCYAYSDSVTDLPMLRAVGHPHAVNPERGLRREAAAAGWPVLEFRRTVPLRARLDQPLSLAHPAVVGFAGAAAFGVAFAWWRRGHGVLPVGRKIRG